MVFREPTECEKRATEFLKAYEQLAYAYESATHRYPKDAETHTRIAIEHLKKTGLDEEDLEPILEPLQEVVDETVPAWQKGVGIASRINDAQEEFLSYVPGWICSKVGG